jgi:hypothetical protein
MLSISRGAPGQPYPFSFKLMQDLATLKHVASIATLCNTDNIRQVRSDYKWQLYDKISPTTPNSMASNNRLKATRPMAILEFCAKECDAVRTATVNDAYPSPLLVAIRSSVPATC